MNETPQSALSPMTENRAECDVDRVVAERFFPGVQGGVFVEVGSARPDFLSISALYRTMAWRVIAIEPNPDYLPQYKKYGFEVLQYAVGGEDKDDVEFSVVDSHGSGYEGGNLSFESFSSLGVKDSYGGGHGLDIKPIKVKLRRLDTILRDHAADVSAIDVVSVDVEGWELEALSGLDFGRYRPKVLIVENLFFELRYIAAMKERGYALWRRLGPNDVYVRRDLIRDGETLASAIQIAPRYAFGLVRTALRNLYMRLKK